MEDDDASSKGGRGRSSTWKCPRWTQGIEHDRVMRSPSWSERLNSPSSDYTKPNMAPGQIRRVRSACTLRVPPTAVQPPPSGGEEDNNLCMAQFQKLGFERKKSRLGAKAAERTFTGGTTWMKRMEQLKSYKLQSSCMATLKNPTTCRKSNNVGKFVQNQRWYIRLLREGTHVQRMRISWRIVSATWMSWA